MPAKMNDALQNLICVSCKSELSQSEEQCKELHCAHCGCVYPLVGGRIPILVRDPIQYLAEIFLYYDAYLRQQEREAAQIAEAVHRNILRMPVIVAFQEAIRRNSLLLRELQTQVLPHVTPQSCASAIQTGIPAPGSSYLIDFMYLQRDWCWLEEGEREVASIENAIFSSIRKYSRDSKLVAVLGAGAGRLACDLCEVFDRVCAVDISLMAAFQCRAVLNGPVEFFELSAKNLRATMDAVRRHTASFSPSECTGDSPRQTERLSYFVADARELPLEQRCVSVVVSAYFTDLVPLRTLLPEVKRVLNDGGLFIHFGPLEYHFVDLADALSAEEFRAMLTANDFSILFESEVSATHLESSVTMASRRFDNWVVVARLNVPPAQLQASDVTLDAVLQLAVPLRFEQTEVISPHGSKIASANLILPSGRRFEGASAVTDMLRYLDGIRTTREVIELLSTQYEISVDRDVCGLLTTLTTLLRSGAIEHTTFSPASET